MNHEVVWVRVAAIFVIGNDDLRAERANNAHHFLGRCIIAHQGKAAFRQEIFHALAFLRIRQAGINVA